MEVTRKSLEKLRILQPQLAYGKDELSGCFFLSATTDKRKSKNSHAEKILLYRWDREDLPNDPCFIYDYFYINANWKHNNGFLNVVVYETDEKIQKWAQKIPSEYCHLNADGSLCLATSNDLVWLQKQSMCFADFFNMAVSQYFYQMAFLHKHGREPWEADRHGLFKAFEIACADIPLSSKKARIAIYVGSDRKKFKNLLDRTGSKKIKGTSICPFCAENGRIKKSKNCNSHKKQTRGYNEIISILSAEI